MKVKERLDKILVNMGFVESASKAKAMIMFGKIIVNGKKIEKAGVKFSENIDIRVLNKKHEWVSRGGVKLSDAIKKFDVEINEKVCVSSYRRKNYFSLLGVTYNNPSAHLLMTSLVENTCTYYFTRRKNCN